MILSAFYSEEEVMKTKTTTRDFCAKSSEGMSALYIITRRGENRLTLDAGNILKCVTLLEEQNSPQAEFVAHNLRKILQLILA